MVIHKNTQHSLDKFYTGIPIKIRLQETIVHNLYFPRFLVTMDDSLQL